MKHLFKTLVIGGLFALIAGMTTSCTPDVYTGPPVLEITGPAEVKHAVSVYIPVRALALDKVAVLLKEYAETEDGKFFVAEYDDNNQPVLGDPITKAPRPQLIFRNGKTFDCGSKGLKSLHLTGNEGLRKNKKFVAFIAATISESDVNFFDGTILSIEFQTPDTYGDDDVAVISESFEGMEVEVRVPQHVKDENRRIRWGVTNLPMIGYNGNKPIAEMLHLCDAVYPASIVKNDTTLHIDHYHAYRRNEKGEIGYYKIGVDAETGKSTCVEVAPDSPEVESGEASAIQYYYNFTPGEPLVLLLAEVDYADCRWGDNEEKNPNHTIAGCDKKHATTDFGWGAGWYWYPYDMAAYKKAAGKDDSILPDMGVGGSTSNIDTDQFWHEGAWYRKIELRLPGPKVFEDGSVKVEVSNKRPDGATITLTPTGKTFCYFFSIFEDKSDYGEGYNDIVKNYFKGDESLWQWFTTSEMGSSFTIMGYLAAEGVQEILLEKYFNTLKAGSKYHIVVNAMDGSADDDGNVTPDYTAQKYQHITFSLPAYSLPAPRLSLTPVTDADKVSPYKVSYIVKNLDYANNPVRTVTFVANYTRDFEAYMKANNYTYTDMAMMNAGAGYYDLTADDLAQVNSAEGCLMEFDVYEDSEFTVAVIGWNNEGRVSNPDSDGSFATARSTKIADATPLNMDQLNSLKGDWTATAYTRTYHAADGTTSEAQKSWKVTIGDLTSPSVLTEEHYKIFEDNGVTKAATDEYFKSFKEQEAAYNKAVLGQNRVLCQGWAIDDTREMSLATPWDLFIMKDYSASVVKYLYHDFGPKWFLQTNEKGEIFVPVNYNRVQPMTCWYTGSSHYLCGANYEEQLVMLYDRDNRESVESRSLPVIVEDENTLVISSFQIDYYKGDENGELIFDDNGNPIFDKSVIFYPNVLYDYYGSPAFYNTYVISNVVLTRGWNGDTTTTEPTTPESGATTYSLSRRGVKIANGVEYKTPIRPLPHTVFVPVEKKAEVKVSTAKQPSKEEIRKNMSEYLKKFNLGR